MTIVHLPTVNDLPFTRATLSWIDDAIETKNFLVKRIEVVGNIALTLVGTALEAITHAAAFTVKCVILPASIWLAPENEKLSPLAELRDHVIRTLSSLTFLPLAAVSIPFTLIAPSCIVKVYGLLGLKQNYGEISEPEEVEQQEITPLHAEPETLKAETSTISSAGTPAEWSASSLFSSAGKVLTVGTQLATLGYIAYSRANPVEIHQHSSFFNIQMIVNCVATAAFITISAMHCKITASIVENSKSTANELNNFNRSLLELRKLLTTEERDASRPTFLELVQELLGRIEPELAKLESNSQAIQEIKTSVSGLQEHLGQLAEEIKKRPTREEGNGLFRALTQASNVAVESMKTVADNLNKNIDSIGDIGTQVQNNEIESLAEITRKVKKIENICQDLSALKNSSQEQGDIKKILEMLETLKSQHDGKLSILEQQDPKGAESSVSDLEDDYEDVLDDSANLKQIQNTLDMFIQEIRGYYNQMLHQQGQTNNSNVELYVPSEGGENNGSDAAKLESTTPSTPTRGTQQNVVSPRTPGSSPIQLYSNQFKHYNATPVRGKRAGLNHLADIRRKRKLENLLGSIKRSTNSLKPIPPAPTIYNFSNTARCDESSINPKSEQPKNATNQWELRKIRRLPPQCNSFFIETSRENSEI